MAGQKNSSSSFDKSPSTNFVSFFQRVRDATPLKNQSQLADALQVGRAAISLCKQKDIVPSKWIFAIAQRYNLNANWLATGEGYPYLTSLSQDGNYTIINKVLPKLNSKGFMQPAEPGSDKHIFSAEWIAKKGNPEHMVFMEMLGTSMEPEIREGDSLIIDQSATEIYAGAIYALGIDDIVLIKRLEKLPNCLILHSENNNYPPVRMSREESREVKILGRLIWIGRQYI